MMHARDLANLNTVSVWTYPDSTEYAAQDTVVASTENRADLTHLRSNSSAAPDRSNRRSPDDI